MRVVDLSKTIVYNPKDPFFMRVKIKHKSHKRSKILVRALGLPFKFFPKNFYGWADDTITHMGVHSTTHIDAPWHYSPTCGEMPAKTIDEIPLDWCLAPGLVIDMMHKADFDPISRQDIEQFLTHEKLTIEPGMIVLIKTGRDKYMGTRDFFRKGTGMSAEATHFLIDKGVKIMGIDQWGWDIPLPHQIKEAKKHKDSNIFWQAHLVGAQKEYWHMEQLTNLNALPYSGFKVAVFPLKIKGASAAPVRVVAIFDD